jgi:hypothetical protein
MTLVSEIRYVSVQELFSISSFHNCCGRDPRRNRGTELTVIDRWLAIIVAIRGYLIKATWQY